MRRHEERSDLGLSTVSGTLGLPNDEAVMRGFIKLIVADVRANWDFR